MNILVTRLLDDDLLTPLEGHDVSMWPETTSMPEGEFREQAGRVQAILSSLTDPVDADVITRAGDLVAVSQNAVGVDNIDLAACTRAGIPVGHTPDVLTETTADTAWALLAAAARRIPEGRDLVAAGEWTEWRPDLLLGSDLHGSTLGIVGLGRIGAAVARRAAGFDMRLVYAGPHRKPRLESTLSISHRELPRLLAEADHVVVTAPLTEATRRMIDRDALATMKPDAVLVNVSRGAVVDTDALVEALGRGRPGAAALDVTDPEPLPADHPLLDLPNCLVIPHLGSASVRTRTLMARRAVTNLVCGLAGQPMPWCANPAVYASTA
jgi:glyoxylate reductase